MASPEPSQAANDAQYRQLVHYTALGAVIVCPIIILMPPRKMDLYTLLLVAGTGIGGNYLVREYTGHSSMERLAQRVSAMGGTALPSDKAREVQMRLKAERAARAGTPIASWTPDKVGPTTAALQAKAQTIVLEKEGGNGADAGVKGVVEKIWLGGEGHDWKAKRDAKEKEALAEGGKGYGGLITDQIWEVWNWGSGSTDEQKKKDEEITTERKK